MPRFEQLGQASLQMEAKRLATLTSVSASIAHNVLSATHADSTTTAATRGDLIIANSTPAWTALAVGAAGSVFQSDGTDPSWGVTLGLGIATPDGTLHVHTATAGAVAASAAADDLVVESSAAGGISILVPDANNGSILFGSPTDNMGARIVWNHDADLMTIGTANAGGEIAFEVADQSPVVRIDSSGNVGIGTTTPDARLEVLAAAAQLRLTHTDATDYVVVAVDANGKTTITTVDGGGANGHLCLLPDGVTGIGAASPTYSCHVQPHAVDSGIGVQESDGGNIAADLVASTTRGMLRLYDGGVLKVNLFGDSTDSYFNSGGNLGIGTTTPDNPLEILSTTTPQVRITHTDATDYATLDIDGNGQLDITTVDGGGAAGHICLVPDGNTVIGASTTPLGTLHVQTATAGGGDSPSGTGDDLVVENSGAGGITIRVPDADNANLYFGSPTDSDGAVVRWNHDADLMTVGTLNAGGELAFVVAAGTEAGRFDASGALLVNDTANTDMTIGLTINQGANDDEALAIKSSDVAHAMTDLAENDTYLAIRKDSALAGGARISGFRDADGDAEQALRLIGVLGEAADTTKSTAGGGVIGIDAQITDGGTAATAPGANANLVSIHSYGNARFLFDQEGEMHSDDVIGVGDDWDDWDDLALAADLSRLPRAKWDQMMRYKAADFERAGLLTLSTDTDGTRHAFIRHKALLQFYACCFREVGQRLARYERALIGLGVSPAQLEVG